LISEAEYTIDEAVLPEGIAHSLQTLVSVRTRPILRHKLALLDTFNGRIAAAGGRLTVRDGNGDSRLEWQPRDRQVRLEISVKTPVDFAWNLPCGPLRDSLQPIIDVRRLLPQVEVEIQGRMLDVLESNRYGALMAGWRDFLRDAPPELPEPVDAARPYHVKSYGNASRKGTRIRLLFRLMRPVLPAGGTCLNRRRPTN
jgi:hypothetical protein